MTKVIPFLFKYTIKVPYSYTCDCCGKTNDCFLKIEKSHKEYCEIGENINECLIAKDSKQQIFENLKKEANNELAFIKRMLDAKNYTCLKDNVCSFCGKLAIYSLRSHIMHKYFMQALIYLGIILVSFLINMLCKDLLLTLQNYRESFFTSIFLFPSIFTIICAIAYIFDIRKINKQCGKNRLNNDVKICINYNELIEESAILHIDVKK